MVEFARAPDDLYAQTILVALLLRVYLLHWLFHWDQPFIRFLLLLIEVTIIQGIREADENYGIL